MTDENLPDLLRESALYFDDEMSSVMRVAATEIEQLRARLADRDSEVRSLMDTVEHRRFVKEKERREKAEAQLAEAREDSERKARCLAFFRSVILSGEPWTETCEREYAKAATVSREGEDGE